MSGSNPYEWLQDLVGHVPELVQPFIVALAGAIPYVEGEGSAALGVFAGIHPLVAAVSGAAGNILAVVLVVLLSSRARDAALARRERRAAAAVAAPSPVTVAGSSGAALGSVRGTDDEPTEEGPAEKQNEPSGRRAKGRKRLRRWLVRFGVPGASLLGPLALPTHLTAATLVASGVSKSWVILWQVIAIVLWTALVTAAATGLITAISAA
ncbi:small multidrug efflux protein [Promicromonospora panici]|uniref:small multidrug efflux protein n=1 Tax=Promicromonospora panici TaxID=2219658 RepID=UPI00101B7842|nr:small multidrug efflux protein [Promicromonospora panici]